MSDSRAALLNADVAFHNWLLSIALGSRSCDEVLTRQLAADLFLALDCEARLAAAGPSISTQEDHNDGARVLFHAEEFGILEERPGVFLAVAGTKGITRRLALQGIGRIPGPSTEAQEGDGQETEGDDRG